MSQQLVTIGSMEAPHPIVQSRYADFEWTVELFEGETDDEPLDLTGYEFEMVILEPDGATELMLLEIGSGVTVADNAVTFAIELEAWEDWPKGCKLPYRVRMTDAGGTIKPLFRDYFNLS